MKKIDYHIMKRPLSGFHDECGDTGIVKIDGSQCFIALIDALGHGKQAFSVACLAENYLSTHYKQNLTSIIKGLHAHLEGTRGAVAAICRLHLKTGILNYSGMGNISMKLFGTFCKKLFIKEGILGYMISSPVEDQVKLYPGDIFVMCSDGIKEHFNPIEFPDILMGNASNISDAFVNKLGKENDDASCIVLRFGI